jgi:beta-phosphoglucomutase
MIKGFLFDLDGVIVDTAKYHFLAWKRLADELKINFTLEDNELLKGVSRMASLDIVLGLGKVELSDDKKMELATRKNEWYVDYITKMAADEILPGALDFIKEARQRGIKIALGSASKNAQTILDRLSITPYFDAIISGNEVSKAKPDPEVFLLGARSIGLEASQCVVFEDAQAGVEAAHNAGMKCIGIGEESILGEAEIVVDGLHDITVEQVLNIEVKN